MLPKFDQYLLENRDTTLNLDDLVGESAWYLTGSSEVFIKNASVDDIRSYVESTIMHNLFDWDFYYNYLDRGDAEIYIRSFKRSVSDLISKLDVAIKSMFTIKYDRVTWLHDDKYNRSYINNYILNSGLPSNIIDSYKNYMHSYHGVKI
jgi:hypothetical protein